VKRDAPSAPAAPLAPSALVWPVRRADWINIAILVGLTALIWCTVYDRWTAAAWQTPLTYLSDPEKGDVLGFLAQFKATADGHMWPFMFTNVPELGAPHVANWDDFPIPEKPLFLVVGLFVKMFGLFAGANLAVMLAHILAAVGFYVACRVLNGAMVLAFAGAIVFAFARYAFAHGLHHLPVTYYWHVPLCFVVCEWVIRGGGIKFGTGRYKFALAVALLTGLQNPYYMNMFAQLVLLGALLQGYRQGWRAALPALSLVAISTVAFVLLIANTPIYGLINGSNSGAITRDYHWLEVYGLKLVDLVLPPPDHPFPPFADLAQAHLKQIILSPGEYPPSNYLGLLGLAALAGLIVHSLRRVVDEGRLPLEAWFFLWIVLYAEVGGFNSIGGLFGIQLFRASTRYAIFLLCLVLMYGVRRLSVQPWTRPVWTYVAAVALALVAIWDQTPPFITDSDLAETQHEVDSDRQFALKMQQALPPQAMVFQIPIMDFPESPAAGVGSYDHFRPYLYTTQLRYSFGSDKGRPQDQWQHDIAQMSFDGVVQRLESYGFGALYINRNAFQDHGDSLVKQLKSSGHDQVFTSDRGDLLCVLLKPAAQPVAPGSY
jgi:hypothetical protein